MTDIAIIIIAAGVWWLTMSAVLWHMWAEPALQALALERRTLRYRVPSRLVAWYIAGVVLAPLAIAVMAWLQVRRALRARVRAR